MSRTIGSLLIAVALIVLSGCGVTNKVTDMVGLGGEDRTVYSGPVYPAVTATKVAFQPAQVDRACRVFAESLVLFPANVSGKEVQDSLLAEAGKRGADQVLVGRTRLSKNDQGLKFLYYGPKHEYLCTDQCGSWKYGYDLWEKQGDWISVGYREWGNPGVVFDVPLIMQVVMLRCQ